MQVKLNNYSIGMSIKGIVERAILNSLPNAIIEYYDLQIELIWGNRPDTEFDSGNPTHASVYVEGQDLTIKLSSLKDLPFSDMDQELINKYLKASLGVGEESPVRELDLAKVIDFRSQLLQAYQRLGFSTTRDAYNDVASDTENEYEDELNEAYQTTDFDGFEEECLELISNYSRKID